MCDDRWCDAGVGTGGAGVRNNEIKMLHNTKNTHTLTRPPVRMRNCTKRVRFAGGNACLLFILPAHICIYCRYVGDGAADNLCDQLRCIASARSYGAAICEGQRAHLIKLVSAANFSGAVLFFVVVVVDVVVVFVVLASGSATCTC